MVAQIKEEVERLRSTRQCEREINWWSHSLQTLQEKHRGNMPFVAVDPLPSHHQEEQFRRQGGMETFTRGCVALCFKEGFNIIELNAKNLFLRIRGRSIRLTGVCHKLCNQDEETDEIFYEWLAKVTPLAVLVFMEYFNLPDIKTLQRESELGDSRSVWKIIS